MFVILDKFEFVLAQNKINKNVNLDQFVFAASTILYKMIVCLSESRGGSSFGESIFSYCGQRY